MKLRGRGLFLHLAIYALIMVEAARKNFLTGVTFAFCVSMIRYGYWWAFVSVIMFAAFAVGFVSTAIKVNKIAISNGAYSPE